MASQKKQAKAGEIFLSLTTQSLISAAQNLSAARYAEATHYSVSAIEYGFKALSRFLDCPISKTHDVSEDFGPMLGRLPTPFRKELVEFVEVGFAIGNERQLSEYGLPDHGVSPTELFGEDKARKWVDDAKLSYKFVSSVIRARILSTRTGNPKVGLLDGTAAGLPVEKPCSSVKSSWTKYSLDDWERVLKNKRADVARTPLNQIGQQYDMVINPFGEDYPESNANIDPPEAFAKILDYISEGGIFMCAGGIPFWYAWLTQGADDNSSEKRRKELAEKRLAIVLERDEQTVRELTLLNTGLYSRFFGAQVSGGPPAVLEVRKDKELEDKARPVSRKLSVFRPLVASRYFPFVPLLAATLGDGSDSYPVAAIPYKAGCLVAAGLNLDAGIDRELDTVADCMMEFYQREMGKAAVFQGAQRKSHQRRT